MFGHLFFNRLKILLKSKSAIFWTLIFPIVLATFFNLAFANLYEDSKFKSINLAIVNNDNFKNEKNFKMVIESLSKDDNQIFNTKYVNEKKAKELLDDGKVSGYIIVNDKIDIAVKSNGIGQTTIKYVVDNYYQIMSVVGNIASFNPEALKTDILNMLNENTNNFNDISNKNIDATVVYFYSLIGMVCLYGGAFGINAVNETEANLSKKGARVSVSPVHKLKMLIAALLVSLVIQYSEILILLGYLVFVLNINFGGQILPVLLLTLVGSIAGLSLGMLIGVSNKKNEGMKVSILISITMLLSFLSGMMAIKMKYIVAENVPILAKINPVNMVTDGLYSLYYYSTLDRYFYNVVSLLIFSVVMITISYNFIRRKKYDSI